MSTPGTFTLGSLTLQLYDDEPDLGAPQQDFGTVAGPLSREPADTMSYVTGWREQTWPVRLRGVTSLEENARECAVRLQHNLSVELAKGANTLVITRRGSSVANTWRVARNQVPRVPFTRIFDKGGILYVPVTLSVAPWVEGESVSRTIATEADTPATVDFTVSGSRPAELKLTATRGFTGSGLQTFMAALIPPDVELADIFMLAKTATGPNWGTYTATSGHETGDDNVRICTDTTYRALYWPGKVQPVGRYSYVARCRIQTGGKGWLAQARETNIQATPAVALTDNDWRFLRLGDWASDGYTPPRIVGKCREAANGILVDWVLAVPLDLGSPFYFHCTAAEVAKVVSEWLDTSMQLSSGAWRSARRYASGPGLEGVGACRLLVAAIDANGALRRPDVTLELEHTPLFDHWVPTPEA